MSSELLSSSVRRNTKMYIAGVVLLGLAVVVIAIANKDSSSGEKTAKYETTNNRSVDLLDGKWNYLPGATERKDGVRITHTGLQIVQQDGSGGQLNSPVNLYGTHLKFVGDFVLDASISDLRGTASLQLYGNPPVVQDEFRVEPASVRLDFTSSKLNVSVWDGKATGNLADQQPVSTQSFTIGPANTIRLELIHKNGSLELSVNDRRLGVVSEHEAFSTGRMWFGADTLAPGNTWRLSKLQAEPLGKGVVRTVDTSESAAKTTRDANGLQTLAGRKRPGFLIGSAMALVPAVSDDKYARIAFGGNFGSMTIENALKFQFVHPRPDLYTFDEADALVDLARSHHMKVHGHALVFGEANPTWVQQLPVATAADKKDVQDVMTSHITKVVEHFEGRVSSWDVVNEPMADYDDTEDGEGSTLREHLWKKALGADYIALAFRTAHRADPSAKLYLNDYGLEADGDRWDALIALVTQLKRDRVPIDGVGFESHVYEAGDKIDPAVLRQHIRQLADLGLKARISEMDVYSDDGTDVQAEQYASVLAVCISEPSCVSFSTWGFDDDYNMWQDDDHSLQHGKDFLWTTGATPTPAVFKLQQLLRE